MSGLCGLIDCSVFAFTMILDLISTSLTIDMDRIVHAHVNMKKICGEALDQF